jgi:deoxyribonuclease-1
MPNTNARNWQMMAVLCALCLLSVQPASATDSNDYDALVSGLFWAQLYGEGGWTLYCGEQFMPDRRTAGGKIIGIEHIYAVEAMVAFLGCRTRLECRERADRKFARMEADMHNLYPEWRALTMYRNGRSFGVVEGEFWRFDDCDVEWGNGVFEPRPIARGNIARALLYMHDTYGPPLGTAARRMLETWHAEDPPSRQERLRNDAIQKLQGRRNTWIDQAPRRDAPNVAAD